MEKGTGIGLIRSPRNVLFGRGQRAALGARVAELGTRAWICTDTRFAGSAECTGLIEDLKAAGVTGAVFDRAEPELPTGNVTACARAAADFGPDVVLGLGGGSCIDLAKATAVLLTHGGEVADYYGELQVPGPTLPVVALPTTAGTGSEVTPVAVLSDPDKEMKIGISSPYLIPHTAVCDPELTDTCPPALTASVGADALAHVIEAFTARRREATAELATERVFVGKNLLADHYASAGMAALARGLRPAFENGHAHARDEVMFGALAGGFALGTAGTAAAHAIQYPVGALTHTPHGVGVGTLLPYVMEYSRPARIPEFAAIARAFGRDGGDEESLSYTAVDAVAEVLAAIGIPATLADLGLAEGDMTWTAEHALRAKRLIENSPREMDLGATVRVVRAAYTGDREALRA